MTVRVSPGRYDHLTAEYPEDAALPPFPTLDAVCEFVPIDVGSQEIIYVGDIEIWQELHVPIGAITAQFVVSDRFEERVAEFRKLLPDLRDIPVRKDVLRVQKARTG